MWPLSSWQARIELADERDAEVALYGFIYTLPAAQNSRRCLRRIRFAGCHDFWVGNRRQRHISRIFDRRRRRVRHRYIWRLWRRHVSRWIARLGAGRLRSLLRSVKMLQKRIPFLTRARNAAADSPQTRCCFASSQAPLKGAGRPCHIAGACRSVTSAITIDETKISYSGYRFPPEIIQQAIWLYVRFTLSFCDVEDLLAERGIVVSYETVRRWVNHFGPKIAANLRKRRPEATYQLASR